MAPWWNEASQGCGTLDQTLLSPLGYTLWAWGGSPSEGALEGRRNGEDGPASQRCSRPGHSLRSLPNPGEGSMKQPKGQYSSD